jgi:hypothetical protein
MTDCCGGTSGGAAVSASGRPVTVDAAEVLAALGDAVTDGERPPGRWRRR